MCREGGGRVHVGLTVGCGSVRVGWRVYTGFKIGLRLCRKGGRWGCLVYTGLAEG